MDSSGGNGGGGAAQSNPAFMREVGADVYLILGLLVVALVVVSLRDASSSLHASPRLLLARQSAASPASRSNLKFKSHPAKLKHTGDGAAAGAQHQIPLTDPRRGRRRRRQLRAARLCERGREGKVC
jgi:hypothetical protein